MMPADTTMILFLNANQTTAIYDLQVKLIEVQDCIEAEDFLDARICAREASELYRRVLRPTYEPENN